MISSGTQDLDLDVVVNSAGLTGKDRGAYQTNH